MAVSGMLDVPSWSRSSSLVLFTCALLVLRASVLTSGDCLFDGSSHNNQSVWKPDPCRVCRCDDPVVFCDVINCPDPKCNHSHGERLELTPGQCCPVCSLDKRPCDFGGRSVAHLTEWTSPPCGACRCEDGRVQCVNVSCLRTPCPPGQVSQLLPGQCCPKCIPAGKPCIDDLGQGRLDGSHWSPLPCVQCICRNGHSRCMVRDCPSVTCPGMQKPTIKEGQCCPSCAAQSCNSDGDTHQDGTSWQRDSCTFCTCRDGSVSCRSLECTTTSTCSKRESLVRRRGQCCGKCVNQDDICHATDSSVHHHGDMWTQGSCEYCACRHGKVTCSMARCQVLVCRRGEERKKLKGECCHRCIVSKTCQYQGQSYQNDQYWDPDVCSSCRCLDGKVTCYRVTCPACPVGTIMASGGPGQCCGQCQRVPCANECTTCSVSDPHHCSSCKENNKLVQNGRCLDQCTDGFFPDTDNTCKDCHENCATCFDKSSQHCLLCAPFHLMRDGQCVQSCGPGYLVHDGHCMACHASCSACSGPRADQCMQCAKPGQVLMASLCVNKCDANFYQEGQECKECPKTCKSCIHRGTQCTSCINGYFLQTGKCLRACQSGYFIDHLNVCNECHPSCMECQGANERDCTSCFIGVPTLDGVCEKMAKCRNGQYMDSDGICRDCSPGCEICYPSKTGMGSVCSTCVDSNLLPYGERCWEMCPSGSYLRDGICFSCETRCSECDSPHQCRKCFPPLLLSHGHCVGECGSGTYPQDQAICQTCHDNCVQCIDKDLCIVCDSSFLLESGTCVKRCSSGLIPRFDDKICEENLVPPTLEVLKPITVAQGGMTDITIEILMLSDKDTSSKHLTIVVERIPASSQLVKADMMGNSLLDENESFTFKDLIDGKIRYIQGNSIRKTEHLIVRAFDGSLYSKQVKIPVVIHVEDLLQLLSNKPLIVKSGMNATLTASTLNIQSSKLSAASEIIFTAINGPLYGIFTNKHFGNTAIKNFTFEALKKNHIVYTSYGNETSPQDLARMTVEDASHEVQFLFTIKVLSKMHFQPVLAINNGGQVQRHGMLKITELMLEATIQDTANSETPHAVYTLTPLQDNPKNGEIMIVVPIPEEGPGQGWKVIGSGIMGARIFRFTQNDIDEGRIFYEHTGDNTDTDTFTFEVADTTNPPNILRDQAFEVSILTDNTSSFASPTLAPGVRLGMTIFENQVAPITAKHMEFQDADTAPKDIIYKITTLLAEDEGRVEHIDFPYVPVLHFTQDDINRNKIIYRPPDKEVGMKEIQVGFTFIVSDNGKNENSKEHKFVMRIIPVNNNPPQFVTVDPEITIAEKSAFPLSSQILKIIDVDTPLANLEITLVDAPSLGMIEKTEEGMKVIVRKGDSFSYSDLMQHNFQYVHAGSTEHSKDHLIISVSDGVHQTNNTIHFKILKIDKSAPVMLPSSSCQVNVTEGQIASMTKGHLAFSDGDDTAEQIVLTLTSEPAHGYFALNNVKLSRGNNFTQNDINQMRLRFHAEGEIGPKPVNDLIYFNVSDSSGNILPNQIFSILIIPVDNLAPDVFAANGLRVEEGGEMPLNAAQLNVMDIDTPMSKLKIVIDTGPAFGHIENRAPGKVSQGDMKKPVLSFTLSDFLNGHMYYVQTDSKDKEPAWDAFLFYVTDGTNESPLQRFNISVQLVNDEAPYIVTEQIFVEEGTALTLTNASMYIIDYDSPPSELIFTVEAPPQNGFLLRKEFKMDSIEDSFVLKEKSSFTYEDILNELIIYQHDDGETTQDSIHLSVTDGDFSDSKTVKIIIGLVGDETPRVTINRGLRVKAGSVTTIKSSDLRATDLDSENSDIMYTITHDPTAGKLQFHNDVVTYILTSSTAARMFKQKDIDSGRISYIHTRGEPTGNILFMFKLIDPEGNELIEQEFFITVLEDRLLPVEVSNNNFPVTEGKAAKLTTDYLSFTDTDSEPGSLTYIVLDGPQLGHLELTGQAGVPIVTFTQSDLAANSVSYIHTSSEELYLDRFIFAVSDGTNEVIHTFYIQINPVDDAIPMLANRGLRVQEGVRKLITEFDLKAVDQDTNENQILFTIIESPSHGSLELLKNGHQEKAINFTMEDIYENRVSYHHDGSETTQDEFQFVITDGTNKVFAIQQDEPAIVPISTPQKFEISVLPLDDGMPVIEANIGLQYLQSSSLGSGNLITAKELLSKDEDTSAEDIVYMITEYPTQGVLQNMEQPAQPLQSFTQDDINRGRIYYKLNEGYTAFQDNFTFNLMDSKPNTVPNNQFHIQWSEISLSSHAINVSETEGIVQIPVARKGNLKQYSIVTCKTLPGSATARIGSRKLHHNDFSEKSGQVQFEEWEEMKTCNIIINDDSRYEGPETFYVEISSPSFAILGEIQRAAVIIHDVEDEPLLQFSSEVISVNETDRFVDANILRSGDLSGSISVVCSTKSLTATGSSLKSLESGSDFVSRGRTSPYRVVFQSEETEKKCRVKLIDDSIHESVEQFEIALSEPSIPASIGPLSTVLVIIEGPNDESFIYLAKETFTFAENSGNIEIPVLREGSDLSHTSMVWCATRLSEKPSAIPGLDYQSASKQITFGPEQTFQVCSLSLLDDDFEPRLEGNETFQVFLNTPLGSNLRKPVFATVVIFDDILDVPTMSFKEGTYSVSEQNKTLNITVERQGDLSLVSSVVCYTRQKTAEAGIDFQERPFSNKSRILFRSGEKSKPCVVHIVDDETFEADEVFHLKLGFLDESSEDAGEEIGAINVATITITNNEDEPRIKFEHAAYSIHEPSVTDQIATVTVKVIRTGDVDQTASVRCSTRDGSANSGIDYNARSEILSFLPGMRMVEFPVDVLYNTAIEWHESFSIQLGPEDPTGSQFGSNTVATITILDNQVSGSLILPAPPIVVSLLHYDQAEQGIKINPSPGYPVVCLSPCEKHHPLYTATFELCEDSGDNNTALIYQWEVAMPSSDEDKFPVFVKVTDKTLFTSPDRQILDSIYFRPFFWVRCVAQLMHKNGNPGIPLKSKPVTIGHNNPICKSPSFTSSIPYTYQAQSFLANLKYVPPGDMEHPNTIHVSVQIPHQDGMLPLISTQPLHNLRLLLAEPVYRQQHLCSNIITAEERAPLLVQGFLGDSLNEDVTDGHSKMMEMSYKQALHFPHQFDNRLREEKSLLLYKNLNLKTCIWQFDAWYHMTELIDLCGGSVVSDFQVKDNSDAHLTVKVPLYVSYIFVQAPHGWGSLEHHTEMEVSFYYSTVLWKSGLEAEERQGGRLLVVRILIGQDGKLMMEFKTQAKFRGLFVMEHHTLPDFTSMVLSPDSLAISFDLELVWTQSTFDSPFQMWRAKSRYNLKDYTGVYKVDLIPCLVPATQHFVKASPIPCVAQQPERFEIPVSFQQTNRPVPVLYSLNTNFQLSNNKKMFLLDPGTEGLGDEDWEFHSTFSKGQKLYGRVQWNPEQDLSSGYELILEKVYICTGRNGYIPSFDPDGELYGEGPQYGCIQPSNKLLHRILVLDRENADMQAVDFHQIAFSAKFAYQDEEYSDLQSMPGVDGFVMDVDPLYKVDSGHQWYLQVLYTIRSSSVKKSRLKRFAMTAVQGISSGNIPFAERNHQQQRKWKERNRYRKDVSSENFRVEGIPHKASRNGTNIKPLKLIYEKRIEHDSRNNSHSSLAIYLPVLVIVVGLLLVILIYFCYRKQHKKQNRASHSKFPPNNTLQVMQNPHNRARSLKRKETNSSKQDKQQTKNLLASPENKCNIIHAKELTDSKDGFKPVTGTEV